METKGVTLTDNIIYEKALQVEQELKIYNFKASQGWIHEFKARNNFKYEIYMGSHLTPKIIIKLFKNLKILYKKK